MFNAGFIFIAGGADSKTQRSFIATPNVELTTVAVNSYEDAANVAKELYENGCQAIELCSGFGIRGTNMVAEAVDYKIPIGAVRFDFRLSGTSGDTVY